MNYLEAQQELANISNQVFMEYSQKMNQVGPHLHQNNSIAKLNPVLPVVVEKIDKGMSEDIFFLCHEGKTYSLTHDNLESFLNSESATTTINNISAELGINLDSLKPRHSILDITRMLINLDKRIGHYRESMLGYNLTDGNELMGTIYLSKGLLNSVIEDFILEFKDSWSPKTLLKVKASLNLLVEVIGNIPITTVDFDHAKEFKKALLMLPPCRNTNKKFKSKNITQVMEMNTDENGDPIKKMKPNTINGYISKVYQLFEWAKPEHHNINPFERKGYKIAQDQDDNEQRVPFTDDDLNKLFNSKIYTHKEFKKPFQFWLPIISLYTGMREDEIAQIHLEDIFEQNGEYVISINRNGKKKTKNSSSKRIIPIPQKLLDMGFMKYVDYIRQTDNERLYPELRWRKLDGCIRYVTEWWSKYREQFGLVRRNLLSLCLIFF
jgi:integrase